MTTTEPPSSAAAAASRSIQHVFRTIDGLPISLDVYLCPSATRENPSPVLLWWHGGGLLQGSRKTLPPHLQHAPTKHHLTVVSADYRLAPQVRLPDILQDCHAALSFVLSDEFMQLAGGRVASDKVFLSGSSAGGWLALLMSSGLAFDKLQLNPFPKGSVKGVVPIYPITDITQPFWRTTQRPVSFDPAGRILDGPRDLGPSLDSTAPPVSFSPPGAQRGQFYQYMVQEALLESLLLTDTHLTGEDVAIGFGIQQGTIDLPPTLILHGTHDDKVPLTQSQLVLTASETRGLPVQLMTIQGKDHLYDFDPAEEMEQMYSFIAALALSG